jgi:hypothetical protein
LIEQHDAVGVGVKELPVVRLATCPGTAMQEDDRQALGIAALLHVQHVGRFHS